MYKQLIETLRRGADFLEEVRHKEDSKAMFTPWYVGAMQAAADELELTMEVFNEDAMLRMAAGYLGIAPERLRELALADKVAPRWVSVDERLPEADDVVLVIVNGKPTKNITLKGAYELAEYDSEGWILEMWPEWMDAKVSHWMQLPEPPDMEETEN